MLLVPAFAMAQDQPGGRTPFIVQEHAVKRISEHVWEIPDKSRPGVPNVAIVVGSRATLIVDTGMGPKSGAIVVREAQSLSKNTQFYLATTDSARACHRRNGVSAANSLTIHGAKGGYRRHGQLCGFVHVAIRGTEGGARGCQASRPRRRLRRRCEDRSGWRREGPSVLVRPCADQRRHSHLCRSGSSAAFRQFPHEQVVSVDAEQHFQRYKLARRHRRAGGAASAYRHPEPWGRWTMLR